MRTGRYTIRPVYADSEISGAIYSGYEIRIPSAEVPERTFFRFPDDMKELPGTGFSAIHPRHLSEKPQSLTYEYSGFELEIPSLDVITNIVQVPYADNDYPVQWLGYDAGMLEGSELPGEGISIITGHNHLNTTEPGPFALLSKLEPGTKMFVLNSNNKLTSFKIVGNELIGADDISDLEAIVNQFENTLALVTCENEQTEGGYANRRVITALPD